MAHDIAPGVIKRGRVGLRDDQKGDKLPGSVRLGAQNTPLRRSTGVNDHLGLPNSTLSAPGSGLGTQLAVFRVNFERFGYKFVADIAVDLIQVTNSSDR